MDEQKHLNMKKVTATIAIFVFAFLIILGSALITNKNTSNKKQKNLEIKEPNTGKVSQNVENKDETNNSSENSNNENTDNEKNNNEVENKVPVEKEQSNGRIPVSNPEAIELCKQAQTSNEKNIYLTFDDGPSPNVTPKILDILKQYDVPATFFVLGSRAELYPDVLKREYNEGHYIANHGYSHKYSSMYSSVQSVIDEYNRANLAIQNSLGNPNYNSFLFRFPGGSSGGTYHSLKQSAKKTLEDMGIASTNWNCLTGDSEGVGRTKEQLLNRLYETAAPYDSLVVLMHDADDKKATVEALPEIIEHYKAEGYTFKNYYDIFK